MSKQRQFTICAKILIFVKDKFDYWNIFFYLFFLPKSKDLSKRNSVGWKVNLISIDEPANIRNEV